MTGVGPKLVVPNKYARTISIDKNMSLGESLRQDFMPHYAGMDGVRIGIDSSVVRDTIVRKLTQSLALVTGDLVEETAESLHDELGESTEWTTVELKTPVSQVIARLTSRVFLGKTLCRTQQWLDIAKNYTLHSFGAMRELRAVPAWLRWVKQWFIPTCIDLRRDVVEAHALIDVECNRREKVARDVSRPPFPPLPHLMQTSSLTHAVSSWPKAKSRRRNTTPSPGLSKCRGNSASKSTWSQPSSV
jgi:hypothetical protein